MHDKAGKILRVNLSTGSIRGESAEAFERRFIGGRGVGAWILFNEMEPETKALDPESIMVLCTGPLTGTDFPGSGRLSIEAKNCNTNGINWANAGGHFGSELRRTGWSHIVVQGKSVEPVYLLIRDDKVELKSAAHLGGADVWETGNVIRSECGDPELQLATIGIAGENLVPMSIVVVDQHRAAGSGGLGAIMGSKNLKAIAVRGTGEIPVAHGEQFQALLRKIRAKLLDSALVKAFRELGTMGSYETPANNASIFPFRNTQDDFYANIESSSIAFSRWKKTGELLEVCSDCPIQCDRLVVEADEGPYKGVKVPLPHSNTQYTFGCRLDMKSPSNIIKAYELVSRYGLDNDQTGVAISWAFECYERGILTKKDTDGLDLTWGNDLAVIAMIRKIAMRDGFGRLLGEGSKKASEVIGKGSNYYSTALKGQDNLDAIRSCKGWSLGEIVSLRGGRHLDGCPTTEFFPNTPPELGEQLFGVKTAFNPTAYEGKGKLVAWFSRFKAAIDSVGVCYFTSQWLSPEFCGPDDYAEALSAVRGSEISASELMEVGRRVHNVEKAFNTLHAGFTRKDDCPPPIYTHEPIKTGPYKGELISPAAFDKMLDEYYEANGWDKATGWQFKETLEYLQLPEVVERLRKTSNPAPRKGIISSDLGQ